MTTPTYEVGNLKVDGSVSGLAMPIVATAINSLSSTGMVNGQSVYTSGLNAANDGGGGWFNWYSTAPGTADGGVLITPPSGGGQYVRQGWTVFGFNGVVSPLWFGAKADGTTEDTAAIQAAINSLAAGDILDGLGYSYIVKACKLKSSMVMQNFNFTTKAGSVPTDFASPVTLGGYNDTNTYSNITVKSVNVNGNRLNVMTGGVGNPEDGGKHGFRVIGSVSNILFEDCTAQYCGSYGWLLYEGINTRSVITDTPMQTDIRFVNCISQYNKAHGVALSSNQYLTISNSKFTHNGLAYGADPGGVTIVGSNAYGNGIDMEGYGIGSWIGEIKVINTDLRHNAAMSIQVIDPVLTTDSRFVIRNGIQVIDCQLDTGSDPSRANPTATTIITAPAANWALGSIYTNIIIQGGSCEGELWYACINNATFSPIQILSTTQLGNGNYSNNVVIYTPSLYTFSGTLNGATYNSFVTYSSGVWTPIISAGAGAITSYTASGTYVKVGRQVTLNMTYSITNNGTGSGYGIITGLPFSANANGGSASTRISGTTGNQAAVNISGVEADVWQYNNTYPWASGAGGQITLVYQALS